MSAKPKETPAPSLEVIINEARTNAWNENVTPRLESLRGWMAGDEWTKGFVAYHNSVIAQLLDKLLTGCKTRDDDQFVRGQIAVLKQVVSFRDMVLKQIDAIERNKKSDDTRGQAGY
jgi:hypothetical protein